jgi:hypothetical protein
MDRRDFLKTIPLAAAIPAFGGMSSFSSLFQDDDSSLVCSKKFELAASLQLRTKPIGQVIIEMGKSFLGTDYVANALEQPGDEHLVVNLHGLDCVSFYENTLVFARCIKKDKTTFEDYKNELQFIRYRGGVINGYPSRLHYTSDYFYDNEKKHVFKVVTKDVGGARFTKTVNFMSTHPESYRQIKEHPEFAAMIRKQEAAINGRKLYHVPTHVIPKVAPKIHDGDIIGITTDIAGMDVSHTGIAIWQDNKLHFMHAPITGAKVQITEKTLAEYLAASPKRLGIMIARPLEP